MKSSFAIVPALLLTFSDGWAADQHMPLPAGKPAGVHQAQLEDGNGMFLVAGAALVGITIALATASNNVSTPAQTSPASSTSTTGTSP
jgi:hypothetical protein